ncbi:hypothetical protein CUJ89_04770 [Burkholderia pyrrocinia]|uniref:Uncharacterized protein n=1 Tax=Burkholderia pyrrocinia TaxID=60550 RepID=A0A2Z5MRR9_BURPY|nr:hypothetical protein CUJ89_04770 [Burkholderia pyrrocinia]
MARRLSAAPRAGRRHCRRGAIPHTVQPRPHPPRGVVSEECSCSIRSSRSSSAPGSAHCCAGS